MNSPTAPPIAPRSPPDRPIHSGGGALGGVALVALGGVGRRGVALAQREAPPGSAGRGVGCGVGRGVGGVGRRWQKIFF